MEELFENPKDLDKKENLIESNIYKIKKNDTFYDILVGKTKDFFIIRTLYYEIKLSQKDLSKLTNIKFNPLDDPYEFVRKSFEQNKVIIKDISKTIIILVLNQENNLNKEKKEIEIRLMAQLKDEKNILLNLINKNFELIEDNKKLDEKYNNLKDENEKLKEENLKIKKDITNIKLEIDKIKNYYNNQANMALIQNMRQMQQMNLFSQFQREDKILFTVTFNCKTSLKEGAYKKINIKFSPEDKISAIIENYRKTSGDNDENVSFIFNARKLNLDLTANEEGLIDKSNVFVLSKRNPEDFEK